MHWRVNLDLFKLRAFNPRTRNKATGGYATLMKNQKYMQVAHTSVMINSILKRLNW